MSSRARAVIVWVSLAILWMGGWFTAGSLIGVRDEGIDLVGPAAGFFVLGISTVFVAVVVGVAALMAAAFAWVDRGE